MLIMLIATVYPYVGEYLLEAFAMFFILKIGFEVGLS